MRMTIIMSTAWMMFASCMLPQPGARVEVIPGSMHDASREFVQNGSPVMLDVRRVRVRLPDGSGSRIHELTIARNPKSGAYWWSSSLVVNDTTANEFPPKLPPEGIFAASEDAMALILVVTPPLQLQVRLSAGHAASMDEAQWTVLAQIDRDLASADPERQTRAVALGGHLPADFGMPPFETIRRIPAIASATRTAGGWIVTLRGADGAIADLTLTDDYRVVDVRRHS